MNFKSKSAYLRWIRYGQATGVFAKVPGSQTIKIRGKAHRVDHKKIKKRYLCQFHGKKSRKKK